MNQISNPSRELQGWGRSIFIGGALAGVLSLLPIINLINLFFLLLMQIGGGITVFLLNRRNGRVRFGESLLAGALSGLIGGLTFSLFAVWTVLRLTPEKIEMLSDRMRMFSSLVDPQMLEIMQTSQFKVTALIFLAIFTLLSILAGAFAGVIVRQFSHAPDPAPVDPPQTDDGNS